MANVKQTLLLIQSFFFEATTTKGLQGWTAKGNGVVATISPSESNIILFKETGTLKLPHQDKHIKCSNLYRWTFETDSCIKLEHLRFGEENPVYLFHLIYQGNQIFSSICPHVCDKDFYTAELTFTPKNIRLIWEVKGDTKNERIEYHYSTTKIFALG